ncbi:MULTISPECIES: Hsp70 family protein [Novosphingobium]|uniref:Hsp70 family protein n=1 Tax=Novosphingobium pentaromativorans TaxID=205844 RepID=A0A2W5NMY0_9SPHN|nr:MULTISPECIES: Hsp70 family protein [Novosphingobium]PZQ54304.1 MAG: Hsp70 family protein [Novosphingobium pentaromativorans]GFE74706.1 molecular chaperone DnaK [Novosphingobium sp. TCA1]
MPTNPAHSEAARRSIGIDFGTTNSVIALTGEEGQADLVEFKAPGGPGSVFRSALCFWQDEGVRGGLAHEAGPWAISEFLEFPQGSRFLQSFKSVAANAAFEQATLFEKRMRFEELGQVFLQHLVAHAGDALRDLPECVVVGRPVRYVGARPDEALARSRYDAMFALLGRPVHYVYEPIGAAFSFASRLTEPATLLVADFGGGTSDFSIVRVEAPGAARRCVPLGSAGIGIAGDRFDYRIMDHLVLPLLGKGGTYRSFDKVLEIPAGHFADFGDWSRLAMMRNRRTLEQLAKLKHGATDPAAIDRMIAVVEHELGFGLYEAVGRLKRMLSGAEHGSFRFESEALTIEADVSRKEFESWIAPDLQRIGETVDGALAQAGLGAGEIDHVFLTGGSSLIPAVRALFEQRFGEERIAAGNELTSIAHGLALIGQSPDLAEWVATERT